jgi:phenylacetate-CoA ligase
MNIEQLYWRLPVPAQNLACTLEGLRIEYSRHNAEFMRLLAEAEQRSQWTNERVVEYRDRLLSAYVRHCAETVPYFRDRFREWGITSSDVRTLDDLQKIPVLSKAELVANTSAAQSEKVDAGKCTICHTSGTTGAGLRFRVTSTAYRAQWATWWRYRRWHGIDLKAKCAYFGGRSVVPIGQTTGPFWRYDHARGHTLFSGYHISDATLGLYVDELRRQRAPWLSGYPSLLMLVANYLLEKGADLGYTPQCVTTLAENLLPMQKRVMTQAFGVAPKQHYGMAEGVANISECEVGKLHVDEDFAAVEFVKDQEVGDYRIVGTSYLNPATAFLRYEPGDRVTLSPETSCPCGRPGRLVEEIDGRLEDYVIRRDGSRVGRMDHVFKDLVNIRESQIVQDRPGEIVIRVVRGPAYTEEDEKRLWAETINRLGTDTDVSFEYRETLPRGKTGKLRFVISGVDRGRLQADAVEASPGAPVH